MCLLRIFKAVTTNITLNVSNCRFPTCFADDLFLLAAANVESVAVLKRTFEEFGAMSGLHPNLQKSNVFLAGVTEMEISNICNTMGMESKEPHVKYLGVPLISGRLKQSDCDELEQKILKKVNSWQANLLSYAGRIQLIISVLARVQTYWSRIFVLPKGVLKDIDAILRRFLWGGAELKRTAAKVAWKEVCLPKTGGGLGIPNVF